ncbi:MAG: hypothetical protein JSS49_27585 [Planctomycetes bacterium]|nr:hypothetical protein [Planctomycetota bacterium]
MNATLQFMAPISRLVWKEFRVQRSLWIAIFLLGLLPQVICRVLASDPRFLGAIIWSMAGMMPLFFIIGSTAILFAGEREERTSDWLQNLAVPPLRTLIAKWGFVVLATIALSVSLSVTAVMLVGELPRSDDAEPDAGLFNFLQGLILVCTTAIVWGSLASLLSRRVVTAVPTMGVLWIATCFLPLYVVLICFSRGDPWIVWIVLSALYLVTAIATGWIGWRWCGGRYFDTQSLTSLASPVVDRWNRLRGAATVSSRIPRRTEFESAHQREWQRLIWQERHRDSIFWWMMCVGCLLAVTLTALRVTHRMVGITHNMLSLFAVCPLAMGILGFRHEGEGQAQRFLAGRGVSPGFIWLAKHAVWLPRAFILPFAICGSVLIVDYFNPVPGYSSQYSLLLEMTRGSETALWLFLLVYGCGQLSSVLFRRVILAIACSGLLIQVTVAWLFLMMVLQIPLWWSVGGVVIWLFVMSWWLVPNWLLERWPSLRPMRLVKFAVVPAMLIVAVGVRRATEIPTVESMSNGGVAVLQQLRNAEGQVILPLLAVDGQQVPVTARWDVAGLRQQVIDQSQLLKVYSQASRAELIEAANNTMYLSEFLPRKVVAGNSDDPARIAFEAERPERERIAREQFWLTNKPRLSVIMNAIQKRGEACVGLEPDCQGMLQRVFRDAAQVSADEGHLAEALQYFCAGLRLASLRAQKDMAARQHADIDQLHMLDQILAWANHPDQTTATLGQGLEQIRDALKQYPTGRETLVAQYLQDSQQLESLIDQGVEHWMDKHGTLREKVSWNARLPLAEGQRFLPWERVRAHRLLEQELVASDSLFQMVEQVINQPGIDTPRFYDLWRTLMTNSASWRETTPLVLPRVKSVDQELRLSIFQRATYVRESLLALRLLIWKREHGSWPERLTDLLPGSGLPVQTVIDPWSGESFRYFGNQVPDTTKVITHSELLSSVGENRMREVVCETPKDGDNRTNSQGQYFAWRNWTGEKRREFGERFQILVHLETGQLSLAQPSDWVTVR